MVRLKTRYLLFEVLYPEHAGNASYLSVRAPTKPVDHRAVLDAIRDSVVVNFGDYGVGATQARLAVKYFSPRTLTGILRVPREHEPMVHAAVTYVSELNGTRVILNVLRVSGTIKKSEQAAVRHNKKFVSGKLIK